MENTVFLRGLTMNMNFFVFMKDFEGKCYAETSAFWTLLYSAAVAFSSINIYWKPVSQELCWPRGYKDFERHESSVLSDDWKQKYSKKQIYDGFGVPNPSSCPLLFGIPFQESCRHMNRKGMEKWSTSCIITKWCPKIVPHTHKCKVFLVGCVTPMD